MSTTKTRRGRPKGTGIDDRAPLIQIAALMADDPDLKPTTAIRRLGITEPSVIRRLRDKFKMFHLEQLAERQKQASEPALVANKAVRPDVKCDRNSMAQSPEIAAFIADMPDILQPSRFPSDRPRSALEVRA